MNRAIKTEDYDETTKLSSKYCEKNIYSIVNGFPKLLAFAPCPPFPSVYKQIQFTNCFKQK